MKKTYIVFIIAGIIIVGMIVGILWANSSKTYDLEKKEEIRLAGGDDENEQNLNIITTSKSENLTSPNCMLIFNTYYKECGHTITDKRKIGSKNVNKTKEQLIEEYKDWSIQKFEEKEIVFYKEKEGICNEHFVIRDEEGYITIYNINEQGIETLEERTDIITTYLPQIDRDNLKNGIKVVGREKLNATIEDYE